jgi:glycosyltransferase involved in cell wall biosynthesis
VSDPAKLRVLCIHSKLTPFGGGNMVGAWVLEALKSAHDVTMLTWMPPDLEGINAAFGTRLAPGDVRWLFPSRPARALVNCIPDDSDFQKLTWLLRICKRIHWRYDLLIASDGEVDFGRPGVQYIHYPYLAKHDRNLRQFGNLSGWRIVPALVRRIYRPWMAISGFSFDSMRSNLPLANSQWVADVYHRLYGVNAQVLYPPVPGDYPQSPWDRRANHIVSLSRLNEDKHHLRIVETVRKVRERFPSIQLHIVGARDASPKGRTYFKTLQSAAARYPDWVFLHTDMRREELTRLLCSARYGIHFKPEEHFGIAVAEMVRAGMIPFVHRSGGQVEIVGRQSALMFQDEDEAASRIASVMADPDLRAGVLRGLEGRRELFTAERFSAELLRWVNQFAADGPPKSMANN